MEYNEKIVKGAKVLIQDCLGVKQDEKLLVVADTVTSEIGQAFSKAGRDLGIATTYVECDPQVGGEPPAAVAAAMLEADAEFLIPGTCSFSHTHARMAASEKGIRVGSMPTLNKEVAEDYLEADYNHITEISKKLAAIIDKGKVVHLTTEKGTDLTIGIEGREGQWESGILVEKGAMGNLPAGEGYCAPLETETNGTLVIDGSIAFIGLVEDDVKLTIKDGRIIDIQGGKTAEAFRKLLSEQDEEANGIAEFSFGTNEGAKIVGCILLDEKTFGTIHIAFGMNSSIGGTRESRIHCDCIIRDPSVWIDDIQVMDKGKHLLV